MMKNTLSSYGSVTKYFHWVMAMMYLGMFMIAYIMINISKSDLMYSLYDLHKATGLLLFCLVSLRFIWRLKNVQPMLSKSISHWQHQAAKYNIIALYFSMFLLPVTGCLTSTTGGHAISFYHLFVVAPLSHNDVLSAFFSKLHELLSYFLIASLTLHVIGTFYHHCFIKDDVFKRMKL